MQVLPPTPLRDSGWKLPGLSVLTTVLLATTRQVNLLRMAPSVLPSPLTKAGPEEWWTRRTSILALEPERKTVFLLLSP